MKKMRRKPSWLKAEMLGASNTAHLNQLLLKYKLHTVCESARCPNRGECFEKGSAVFLIMGDECTRNCRFCAIKTTTKPLPLDAEEPRRVAELTKELKLKHVIITSVTRDDIEDGGSGHFAKTIREIRKICGNKIYIEVLTPDFLGDSTAIETVIMETPTIFNHNLETVKRLYPEIRPLADYERSLMLLRFVKENAPEIITKTGIMVGLGETDKEVYALMEHARKAGVDMLTVGQYLQATQKNIAVNEYIHPGIFRKYKEIGEDMGFLYVESGPLVRSSYYSRDLETIINNEGKRGM
ncbi:MAG TPA: lipoyl synthase [Candidatus Cloacimonetes bacterium]|nr:lipoyl synthase [Candidatus Cloacimonadota bacterium]HEX38216.1 lipoyl synthase [Candidatus Cloacimonadota bacterium]